MARSPISPEQIPSGDEALTSKANAITALSAFQLITHTHTPA